MSDGANPEDHEESSCEQKNRIENVEWR